ncbi:hypothetical protein K3759_17360 (plasmid) [Sulfitobacter sp. W027]|uniref:hypothetical protein n=1 Tax=Sulfitobacter sp. W027 TaxID=2867025 RepID=UPI0021A8A562|nr:hypothetical protein [Sulfitobacter sp. W027]UWR35231.1 hypothetical protein K3759_17360 [Sulfitobacter sp. W027]
MEIMLLTTVERLPLHGFVLIFPGLQKILTVLTPPGSVPADQTHSDSGENKFEVVAVCIAGAQLTSGMKEA